MEQHPKERLPAAWDSGCPFRVWGIMRARLGDKGITYGYTNIHFVVGIIHHICIWLASMYGTVYKGEFK